jgi:4-diphosphocytidyl-2-C-methyl-D-erythritol kinase
LRIPAFAKINLSLEVIGRRDDGYHDVATILQTIDLADELALEPANVLSVTCDDPDLAGESNIVWRAATNLASRAGILPRARIHITKRIPVAAGLGGGSADAAAALLGLNRMWELNLSAPELHQVAATLGSDVPFLLTGGTALATGRGDVLHSLPPLPETHVLLVAPRDTIDAKTPTLYRALARSDFSDGAETRRLGQRLSATAITSTQLRNTFERPARQIFPGLAGVWNIVAESTGHEPRLSGAGPAVFCLPSSETERRRVQTALRGTGATAYLVRTLNPTGSGDAVDGA